MAQESRPGDFFGKDSTGAVRIDRVIPLWGLLSILGVAIASAVTSYFEQKQTSEYVKEMKADIKSLVAWQSTASVRDAGVDHELRDLRRRIESLEARVK